MSDGFAENPGGYLRAAADQTDTVLASLNQPPESGSPMAFDLELIHGRFGDDEHGDLGQRMIESVAIHAGRYCALVSKGVRELADAVDHHNFVTLPPIVRSHIEYSARAAWLTGPIGTEPGEGCVERVARHNLDLFTSICYHRYALKALKSPDAGAAKAERTRAAAYMSGLFSDPPPQLSWAGPGDEVSFSLAGYAYLGLTATAKKFLESWDAAIPAKGIYDSLSGFSHPSHLFLNEMLTWIHLDNRRLAMWDVDAQFIIRLTSYSNQSIIEATRSLGTFIGRRPD